MPPTHHVLATPRPEADRPTPTSRTAVIASDALVRRGGVVAVTGVRYRRRGVPATAA